MNNVDAQPIHKSNYPHKERIHIYHALFYAQCHWCELDNPHIHDFHKTLVLSLWRPPAHNGQLLSNPYQLPLYRRLSVFPECQSFFFCFSSSRWSNDIPNNWGLTRVELFLRLLCHRATVTLIDQARQSFLAVNYLRGTLARWAW